MSTLVVVNNGAQLFGAFKNVNELADRLECDGAALPLAVIGAYTLINPNLPADFLASDYTWDGTKLVKKPVAPFSLAVIRADKSAQVRAERDRRKFNGVQVQGKWIHTDTYSRTQWLGMVMMGAAIPQIAWTTMDGSTINTSQTLAGQVFQATAALDQALFAKAAALIAQIEASNDPATVDITTGWQATYGG